MPFGRSIRQIVPVPSTRLRHNRSRAFRSGRRAAVPDYVILNKDDLRETTMSGGWYYQVMGQELGPVSPIDLKTKAINGQIQRDTLIRKGLDGKWIFGGEVKGLFPPVPEPKPIPAPVKKPDSATISSTQTKPGTTARSPSAAAAKPTSSGSYPVSIPMVDDSPNDVDDRPDSATFEFYDFVGFREAITPKLYDAVKQYATDRGITIGQVNRRALANFIQRPELASNLLVKSVAEVRQPVNEKRNRDGGHPLSSREKDECATFRVSLYNCGHESIRLTEGVFLPKSVEARTYDTVADGTVTPIDHRGHIPVRLRPLDSGKPIRLTLDETIPAESSKEIVFWFYDDTKPSLTNIHGQIQLGSGIELAISDFFTMILHGDSPSFTR